MANARQVQGRIGTAKNISKITRAMEMVAASKLKRTQNQAIAARPYAEALAKSLKTVCEVIDSSLHPLLSNHSEGISIALVVSTDKGLCGNLNGYLLKKLLEWKKKQTGEIAVVAVGKKAISFTRSVGIKVYAQFSELPEKVTSKDILPITSLVMEGFLSQEFKSVDIIYTDFINTLSQQTRHEALLPIAASIREVEPLKNKDQGDDARKMEGNLQKEREYLFEPSPLAILNRLLPFYIENAVFHAFLESRASEHSARMVAMKNASENASELVEELQLIYNKSRQQSITGELLDITTAILSLE